MATEKEVMAKLEGIIDPELGLDIVELGLVYGIGMCHDPASGRQKARIRMTFTSPLCPMIGHILHQMKEKVEELPGLEAEIEVVFDPPWSVERMSQKAKLRLGMI